MSILSRSLKHLPDQAIFLGSGTGFWEFNHAGEHAITETVILRVDGWLVGRLFFVLMSLMVHSSAAFCR